MPFPKPIRKVARRFPVLREVAGERDALMERLHDTLVERDGLVLEVADEELYAEETEVRCGTAHRQRAAVRLEADRVLHIAHRARRAPRDAVPGRGRSLPQADTLAALAEEFPVVARALGRREEQQLRVFGPTPTKSGLPEPEV